GGMALPRLNQTYDRMNFSLRRAEVERQLSALGRRAAYEGRDLELTSWPPPPRDSLSGDSAPAPERLIELPGDWRL
ncbi:hypothetical protein ACSTIQ_00055, partial [Vibrio parahaemolyticus]